MFTKAIVLGDAEFRSLVTDFIEMAREEFEGKEDLTVEEFEEFLGTAFEEVLDVYGVDEAVVHLKGEWREVSKGEDFVDEVRRYYKDLDKMLKDMKGLDEGKVEEEGPRN
jgi:hypothetical protein